MRLSCALSVGAAAKVLHVTARTLHNGEAGASRVPYAAYKLLRLLRGGELPGAAWKGWRLHGDTLYSPEGHAFGARDHAWWSLLVRRAAQVASLNWIRVFGGSLDFDQRPPARWATQVIR